MKSWSFSWRPGSNFPFLSRAALPGAMCRGEGQPATINFIDSILAVLSFFGANDAEIMNFRLVVYQKSPDSG